MIKWLIDRQVFMHDDQTTIAGFNGRVNKIPDSCYTYWVIGSLKILKMDDLIQKQ